MFPRTATRAAHTVGAALLFALIGSPVLAAGSHGGGHGHGMAMHGQAGKASQVSRTIDVVMHDNYYEPESITVKAGETIRLKVKNAGELVHEFNIGTAAMHADHQKEMQMMVDHGVLKPDSIDMKAAAHMQKTMGHGMHNEANSVLLEPGKSSEIIWTFPKDAEIALEFGCNIPGHYESGMQGRFRMGGGS